MMNSKKGLVEFLSNVKVADKVLSQRIAYTLRKFTEDSKNVMKADLQDLAADIHAFIATSKLVPVENALKPTQKEVAVEPTKEAKKIIKKNEVPVIQEKEVEVLVKQVKQPKEKAVVEKKPKVEEFAVSFPATIDYSEIGTLAINTEIKEIKDLLKATEEGKVFYFAMYWSKKHLSKFTYDVYNVSGKKFKEFPNDLDLMIPVHISEDGKVVYVVSIYSEVLLVIKPEDLEVVDGVRYTAGLEYNIYEAK